MAILLLIKAVKMVTRKGQQHLQTHMQYIFYD